MSEVTNIWQEYDKGRRYLEGQKLYSNSELAHAFIDGDQWRGLKVPDGFNKPPQLNILQPIMKSATALVGQNAVDIVVSPLNSTKNEAAQGKYAVICEALNLFITDTWEQLKMDAKNWDILEDAYITGDALTFFYWHADGEFSGIKADFIDNVNVMFGDENESDIQQQPYILIPQRKPVDVIREEARKNGIDETDIDNITADNDTDRLNGDIIEVDNDKKCTVVTKLWKKDGVVHIARTTKTVVYQQDTALQVAEGQAIRKMKYYPIAKYSWKPVKNSARGKGDILDKIPNQIAINKALFRFLEALKAEGYPHKVVVENAISASEVAKLNAPGSTILLQGQQGQDVRSMIQYLNPGNISPHAANIWKELSAMTRELAGAGDNLENINPEQASGAAITAAREAKALNLNSQTAAFKQFIEDVALIWADLWQAYSTENIIDDTAVILPAEFPTLRPHIRVDISPKDPYSKLAQQQTLKEFFLQGAITFEEYVELIDDSGTMPKAKLQELIEKRKQEVQTDDMQDMQDGIMQGQLQGI